MKIALLEARPRGAADRTMVPISDPVKSVVTDALAHSGSLVMITRLDGTIAYVNETFARVTGYEIDEIFGIRPKELRADPEEDRTRIYDVVSAGHKWEGELRNKKKTGEIYWELASISPFRDDAGAIVGFLKIAQDITAQKQVEETLRGHLLRSERLATLGTLAAGVGHELNNVGTVLVAAIDEIQTAIAERRPPDVEALEQLDLVQEHMTLYARQLLTLGRPGQQSLERIDLSEIVRHSLSMIRLLPRVKWARLEGVTPERPVHVNVHRARIEQVLVNLVINAADATAETRDRTPRVTVRVEEAGDSRARCEVADNGCGIPPDKLELIFEPYFTTKPEGRGTGLGLPVVRQIVESYGGKLVAKSQLGDGSAFAFDLPLA